MLSPAGNTTSNITTEVPLQELRESITASNQVKQLKQNWAGKIWRTKKDQAQFLADIIIFPLHGFCDEGTKAAYTRELQTRTDILLEYVQPDYWVIPHVLSFADGATQAAFEIMTLDHSKALEGLAMTLYTNELPHLPLHFLPIFVRGHSSALWPRNIAPPAQHHHRRLRSAYRTDTEQTTDHPRHRHLDWEGRRQPAEDDGPVQRRAVVRDVGCPGRSEYFVICLRFEHDIRTWPLTLSSSKFKTIRLPYDHRVASIYSTDENPEAMDLKSVLVPMGFHINKNFDPKVVKVVFIHRTNLPYINWMPNAVQLRHREDVKFYLFGVVTGGRADQRMGVECIFPYGGIVSITLEAARKGSAVAQLVDFKLDHPAYKIAGILRSADNAQKCYYDIFGSVRGGEMTLMTLEEEYIPDSQDTDDSLIYWSMLRIAALEVLNFRHFILIDHKSSVKPTKWDSYWAPGVGFKFSCLAVVDP
ncbi:LOW QUALITY PROTEIN: hypothetical protein BC938DRAFT_479346 [Jimgerdemannia flammicorona]|uniref:Uncharacterized protein n=1 Tax=Jimgerdemannia flammicorona TaxID=994334 RepID=A0A433QL40_9FUNG|nr:LOW QUALITY PROTEIN: hypothetical protein BC938DRAFT_479346 [Jimgerdemannia flammicorona]